MEPRITAMLVAFGLVAGLLFGSGEVGSGTLLAIAAAGAICLLRSGALQRDRC